MKLVVKESSEKRRRRQDFPTPADVKQQCPTHLQKIKPLTKNALLQSSEIDPRPPKTAHTGSGNTAISHQPIHSAMFCWTADQAMFCAIKKSERAEERQIQAYSLLLNT